MRLFKSFGMIVVLFIAGCSKCDSDAATNKLLALQRVQGRIVAKGAHIDLTMAAAIAKETGAVSEAIAKGEYDSACELADGIASKLKVDLNEEQKGMLTIQDLAKDGGKGTGTCSVADAAKKQMEIHGLLQAEVNAGKRGSEVFSEFQKDTVGYAEMLSTDPSKACELFENLRKKYKL